MTREGSEEIVHRCSLVIVFSALLHNIRSISDQRRLRGDCTQVQSCHSLPCSLTQYKEYK